MRGFAVRHFLSVLRDLRVIRDHLCLVRAVGRGKCQGHAVCPGRVAHGHGGRHDHLAKKKGPSLPNANVKGRNVDKVGGNMVRAEGVPFVYQDEKIGGLVEHGRHELKELFRLGKNPGLNACGQSSERRAKLDAQTR